MFLELFVTISSLHLRKLPQGNKVATAWRLPGPIWSAEGCLLDFIVKRMGHVLGTSGSRSLCFLIMHFSGFTNSHSETRWPFPKAAYTPGL